MLLNFAFQNFRSFKDEVMLSMEAAPIKELHSSVFQEYKYNLLPAAVVYGPNSSGKSNLIESLAQMRGIVLGSVRLNPTDKLPYDPFALDLESAGKPSSFEVQFLWDGARYTYGVKYNSERILEECLYEQKYRERDYPLFLRSMDDISVSSSRFAEGIGKESSTPANRLFLSLVAQLNGEKSKRIIEWFNRFNVLNGLSSEDYEGFSLRMFKDNLAGRHEALEFFDHLQLGFEDILVTEIDFASALQRSGMPEELQKIYLKGNQDEKILQMSTKHKIFDKEGHVIDYKFFDKNKMESAGTKKMIELSGPVFDTLAKGQVLVIDELDAKLHPMLTQSIVKLFMDPEVNTKHAQLIFNTHDVTLLNLDFIRRDQIWFTQKDKKDSTELYSLVEFRDDKGVKVRKDRSIAKDYMNGRYGAIPNLK